MADKSPWGKVLALGLLVTGGTSFLFARSSADAASVENQILLNVRFALVDSSAGSVLESKLTSLDRGDQALNVRTLRPDPEILAPQLAQYNQRAATARRTDSEF